MDIHVFTKEPVIEIDGVKYHHHPNGGGLVAETAEVDDSAFIGPVAKVCGSGRVCDQAFIFGNAWIFDSAVVADNAQIFGNARIFGAGITDVESALASKKVIVTAEEIVDTEDIRHNPGLTKIPYYVVDAVVHAPFGAYPGECPGVYASDTEHVGEVFLSMQFGQLGPYLEKWVYSVSDDREMLEKRVGLARLDALRMRSTRKEGFRA